VFVYVYVDVDVDVDQPLEGDVTAKTLAATCRRL
jgi:hypothetical protein